MKVCIKDKEFNTNYHKVFGEEKAKADGYTIFEVPKGYENCAFEDFDTNGFNVELYNKRQQSYINQQRITELKRLLKKTDYKAIKYGEGLITAEEYAAMKTQRQAWRDEINKLEQEV